MSIAPEIASIISRSPPVDMTLPDPDSPQGNTIFILSQFRRHARAAGWMTRDIESVTDAAMDGDYEHLREIVESTRIKDDEL